MLILVGDRVNLRTLVPQDAKWLARAMAQGSWWRLESPWDGRPSQRELRAVASEVRVLAASSTQPPERMVIETHTGRPIGTVTRYWADEHTQWLEVGVGIYRARYWGKGYGAEALSLWVDHLFDTLPLRRIGLRTWTGNPGMIAVARQLGFRQEAAFREAYAAGAHVYDRVAFGVLRREWRRTRRMRRSPRV
jgi:RimJ/RimL family protein N-acetyltransferase